MDSSDDVRQLLTEIRDLQKEHLREYKNYAARAVEMQQLAVKRQATYLILYKRVLLIGGILIVGLVVWLLFFFNQQVSLLGR